LSDRATAPLSVLGGVLALLVALLAACDSGGGTGGDAPGDSLTVADVSTDSVFVEDVNDRTVTFRYYGTTPTPCHEPYRIETAAAGVRVRVTVVAAAPANSVCVQVQGRVTLSSLQVVAPVRGAVTFEFSRIDGPPITREVQIPAGNPPPPSASVR
jgi:hypothetical protein